jgi:hypothetical protein
LGLVEEALSGVLMGLEFVIEMADGASWAGVVVRDNKITVDTIAPILFFKVSILTGRWWFSTLLSSLFLMPSGSGDGCDSQFLFSDDRRQIHFQQFPTSLG